MTSTATRTLRKIDVGCGAHCPGDFIPIDAKTGGQAYPLCYSDGVRVADESVEVLHASHVLEHFSHRDSLAVLTEWVRVLAPGGLLQIAVPNFRWIAEKYLHDPSDTDWPLAGYVMGGHVDENDKHGAIFDEEGLTEALGSLGLVDIQPWVSEVQDCAALPVSLNLQGRKPHPLELPDDVACAECRRIFLGKASRYQLVRGPEVIEPLCSVCYEKGRKAKYQVDPLGEEPCVVCGGLIETCYARNCKRTWPEQAAVGTEPSHLPACDTEYRGCAPECRFQEFHAETEASRQSGPIHIPPGAVQAVMTLPRLAFTDNLFCCMQALQPLGIQLTRTGGVFWNQGMTQAFLQHMEDGTRYILSIDYDSVFTKADVIELIRLMEVYPDADAICPLQMKREEDVPLFCVGQWQTGPKEVSIPREALEMDLLPVTTGHFGLTILRVESLRRLPHPWFHAETDAEGKWGEGRMDADISYWRKWKENGLTLFLANRVVIGHIQQVVSWPGRDLRLVNQFLSHYNRDGKPSGEVWQ